MTENNNINSPEVDAEIAAKVEEMIRCNPIVTILDNPDASYLPSGWAVIIHMIAVAVAEETENLSKADVIDRMLYITRYVPALNWAIRKSRLAELAIDAAFNHQRYNDPYRDEIADEIARDENDEIIRQIQAEEEGL